MESKETYLHTRIHTYIHTYIHAYIHTAGENQVCARLQIQGTQEGDGAEGDADFDDEGSDQGNGQ